MTERGDLYLAYQQDDFVAKRAIIEVFFLTALGIKPLSLLTIPGELPDADDLGKAIDKRFREGMEATKTGTAWQKLGYRILSRGGKYQLGYKHKLIKDAFRDIVLKAPSYKAHMEWTKRLNLDNYEYDVRPSIREIYFYNRPEILNELQDLMQRRQEIKAEAWKKANPNESYQFLIYPEERYPDYLKGLGTLLGYPECCTEAYLSDRDKGENVEKRASLDLQKRLREGETIEPWAYFVKDFFPCSPTCKAAQRLGKKAYEALKQVHPGLGEEYLRMLKENMNRAEQNPVLLSEHMSELKGRTEDKE